MIDEGSVVGEYLVQDRIGQGASAIVHRGVHRSLGRPVVLKFLPTLHHPVARARFLRESAALRRMDHPNVVQVLDTGEVEGTPYMVFDFVPGGSLAEQMGARPLRLAEAVTTLDGIAKGLDYAHGRGIVHRDVKPGNVLLSAIDAPVIADFGLVRLLEHPSATAAGMFAGTPAYMSPEQAEGLEVGPASDQYSLAAIAYEMLTGQVPFPGDTIAEVVTALLTRHPTPPSAVRTGLSPEVDEVVLRGLAKRPEERWASCQALIDALLGAMISSLPSSDEPLPAVTAPPSRVGMLDPRMAGLTFEPSEPYLTIVMPYGKVRPKKRARRRLLTAVAAAAVMLGSLAAGAYWSGGDLNVLAWSHPAATAPSAAAQR
jgi:serine/threonine-protein kinase